MDLALSPRMDMRPVKWWLENGTEVCDVCGLTHAYQLEYRCYDCDAPICPVCVVTVRKSGHAYCPGCGTDDSGKAS